MSLVVRNTAQNSYDNSLCHHPNNQMLFADDNDDQQLWKPVPLFTISITMTIRYEIKILVTVL